jgi:hypothetical protein
VLVFTEQGAAIDAFKRYRLTSEPDAAAEQAAVRSVSRSVSGSSTNYIYGTVILINLSDPNYLTTAKIDQDIVNRYTFYALAATAGTDPNVNTGNNATSPRWFESGIYTRQSYRWATNGANGGYLVEAAQAARAGKVPPLSALQTFDQERAAFGAYDYYTVTARTYAVVSYLYEAYGTAGVASLLRENKNGSVGRFNELLKNLTGLDADGLDGAVTGWLLGLPTYRAASPGGEIKVEALVYGSGRHGELLVDEAAAACLFDVTDQNTQVQGAPGLVGLSIGIGPDGAFSVVRPSARAGNAVSASGKIEAGGGISGSYRVTNEVTNCDSGAVTFSPS